VHILSFIAAMLLSLFGYAVGNALRAGKAAVRKPGVLDLLLVLALWAAVGIARGRTEMNGWLFILAAIAAGFLIGTVAGLVAKSGGSRLASVVEPHIEKHLETKRFPRLRVFFFKAGTFQSQIFLGLVFIVVIGPAALAVKAFSDPLRIKKSGTDTQWVPRPEASVGLESSRKPY